LECQRDHHQKMKPLAVTDVTSDVTFVFFDVISAVLGFKTGPSVVRWAWKLCH
jgi:hypothetical protein